MSQLLTFCYDYELFNYALSLIFEAFPYKIFFSSTKTKVIRCLKIMHLNLKCLEVARLITALIANKSQLLSYLLGAGN